MSLKRDEIAKRERKFVFSYVKFKAEFSSNQI